VRKTQRFRQAHDVVHANAFDEHVRRRIVTDRDHDGREVTIRERRDARREASQNGTVRNDIRRAYYIAICQFRLTGRSVRGLLCLMIKFRKHRDLDGTCLWKYLVRMNEELLAGIEVQDSNAKNSVEPLLHVDNSRSQAIPQHLLLRVQRHGRRVRCRGSQYQNAKN
jgi:hypothetical protein